MAAKDTAPDAVRQAITGTIEALIAFGVMLAAQGLISRAELARGFRFQVQQQQRNRATIGSQAEFEARIAAPLALAEFFSLPVNSGPIVIEGGRGSEDPPDGAA